ncbi:MAG TPA: M20/M25/M40 family metallo-hydrolase, partial [Vicinamibacterales bacterium]|nr:M20/M25/M40 family metallo-hydrolase [Vicinamibacterales bacterium]
MTKPGSTAALTIVVIVALAAALVLLDRPPAPLPEDAPEGVFSAARAMAHVERVAERPHPTGSADNARVREYLAGVLGSMGHRVERQRAVAIQAGRGVRAARVENLMVRVPGTRSTGAVLFASHYDSVPAGPGASDDASAVAVLVETLRALRALPPAANDLIFLFTDAEEYGLLGATAFVDQHPWLKDVRVAINFEARGTRGPSLMFETGPGNGPLVREWAQAVPRPAGASFTDAVYKRMPNDTDFSEFKRHGIAGLNFAFIDDWARYHTPRDDVDALDRGSLQHHGEAALGLARRLGAIDLATLQGSDAVYFSVPGAGLVVRYPVGWALPFAVLAIVVFVAAVVRARRQASVHLGGLVLAIVIHLGFVALAGFLGFRFARWIAAAHHGWLGRGDAAMSAAYAVVLMAAVASVWLALHTLLRKRFAGRTLALSGAFLLAGGAVASAWFLPGTSYVPLWP